MKYPGFLGPAFTSQSRLADAEDLVNWHFARIQAENAKVRTALYPTPGVQTRFTLPTSPIRGLFCQEGRGFVVGGGQIYEFFEDDTFTARGPVAQDSNPATMTTNGDGGGQLFVTSGNIGYVFNLGTNVLTPVVPNAAVAGAIMGAMLNGRFLAMDPASSTLGCSDVFNGLVYNAFAFGQRSTASDPWRSMLVSTATQKIYMLGEFTSDVYYDTGESFFPFTPISGALIPWGIAAPFSAVDDRGKIKWLAQNKDGDRVVVALSGYASADRISNEAVETAMAGYSRVDDAEAFVHQEQGRTFYVLNFPSANVTWVQDDDGGWHRRSSYENGRDRVWRARCHALAFGRHLVGDRVSGTVSELSSLFGHDFGGGPIRRVRRTPGIVQGLERVYYPGLRLYLETGVGLPVGQGFNPEVLYRFSNDAGNTWGSYRSRTFGKQGVRGRHVDFLLNGSGYDRVDEVVISDPVPARVLDAYLLGMDGQE